MNRYEVKYTRTRKTGSSGKLDLLDGKCRYSKNSRVGTKEGGFF